MEVYLPFQPAIWYQGRPLLMLWWNGGREVVACGFFLSYGVLVALSYAMGTIINFMEAFTYCFLARYIFAVVIGSSTRCRVLVISIFAIVGLV
jgi:hypothetical protein